DGPLPRTGFRRLGREPSPLVLAELVVDRPVRFLVETLHGVILMTPAPNASFTRRCHNACMSAPKILAVASAADLDFRYGCTPAWWQIWKGLYEAGADLIVTPYRGRAIESPWWRTAPNPLYREAEAFAAARGLAARLKGDTLLRRAEHNPADTTAAKLTREVISRYVTPRWPRHLERILRRAGNVAAVTVFTVPMAHLRGMPTRLRERF